jgi:hypothetical protein
LKLKPYRDLKSDLELTITATSYAGTGSSVSLSGAPPKAKAVTTTTLANLPKNSDGAVDFKKMSPAQKVAYSRQRIQADLVKSNGAR